jgi:hypothetical protein
MPGFGRKPETPHVCATGKLISPKCRVFGAGDIRQELDEIGRRSTARHFFNRTPDLKIFCSHVCCGARARR